MNQKNENLDHLTEKEVEVFYEDYLNLKASDIVKKYNLADKLSKRLHAIIPKRITSLNCEKCGKALYADWLTKAEVNDFSSNHSKCSCGHVNVISDELDSFIIDGNIQCDCKYCKWNEKINKKIILEEKLGRPSIPLPFTDTNNTVSLSDVSYLMGLIYARWKEDESFINPPKSNGIKIYPDIPSNEDVKTPLLKCLRNDVLLIDLENSDLELINILENGSVNYFYTLVHLIPNFKKDEDFELASVKEIFEWLWQMNDNTLNKPYYLELSLVAEVQKHLQFLVDNPVYAQTLDVPDQSRKILDSADKLRSLKILKIEVDELAIDIAHEIGPIINNVDYVQQRLMEALIF